MITPLIVIGALLALTGAGVAAVRHLLRSEPRGRHAVRDITDTPDDTPSGDEGETEAWLVEVRDTEPTPGIERRHKAASVRHAKAARGDLAELALPPAPDPPILVPVGDLATARIPIPSPDPEPDPAPAPAREFEKRQDDEAFDLHTLDTGEIIDGILAAAEESRAAAAKVAAADRPWTDPTGSFPAIVAGECPVCGQPSAGGQCAECAAGTDALAGDLITGALTGDVRAPDAVSATPHAEGKHP